MSTTAKYQKKSNYYYTISDCQNHKKNKINTNPRYPYIKGISSGFNQTHFTAGDVEQFYHFKDSKNGNLCNFSISLSENIFNNEEIDDCILWNKYKDINAESVNHTFEYIFNKFKKGIFIKIINNKLRVFLPFSKHKFKNEWSEKIKYDPKFGNDKNTARNNFLRHVNQLGNRSFNPRFINKYEENWYSNNCLLRYEHPISESDTGIPAIYDMFENLCNNRKLPDIELFINRRDFPIITKDETEPYEHIFGDQEPLLSHNFDKYCPILSMVGTKRNADIPIPTFEDWERLSSQIDRKFFPKDCQDYRYDFDSIKWEDKKPIAIFRGASTGCGTNINDNLRLKLADLGSKHKDILDAGINKWNVRPRISPDNYLKTIEIKSLPFYDEKTNGLVKFVSPIEQAKYKYIINVDGHVSAYRLSLELSMGSVILLVDSKYSLWFKKYLIEYKHYVPVKNDLSNLLDQINWCIKNDEKCKEIAENAKIFYNKYLMKEGVLDYLQKTLIDIKKQIGIYIYNYKPILEIQNNNEEILIKKILSEFPKSDKKINKNSQFPPYKISYSLWKGTEWIINYISSYDNLLDHIKFKDNIFTSKTTIVDRYYFLNRSIFALKRLQTDYKKTSNEFTHSAFTGLTIINNLIKKIPNFIYTFSYQKDNYILLENINGIKFNDYICKPSNEKIQCNNDNFNFTDFFWIFMQIALTLHVAQRDYNLVHNDLRPWNIILKKINKKSIFNYPISENKVIQIETDLIPIIVDYEKCSFNYQDYSYSIIDNYKFSSINDLIALHISTLSILMRRNLSHQDKIKFFKFANYFGKTKFAKGKVFTNFADIRYFIENVKDFTRLLYDDKYELDNQTPLDYFNFLSENFPENNKNFKIFNYLPINFDKGNPNQVFDYILSSNYQERVDSYLNVFYRFKKCTLPQPDNLLSIYHSLQTLSIKLNSLNDVFKEFLIKNKKNENQYQDLYDGCIKLLEKIYLPLISKNISKPFKYNKLTIKKLIPYNNLTFVNINKMNQFLDEYDECNIINYHEILNILTSTFLSPIYPMPSTVKDFYQKDMKNLLESPIHTNMYISNRNTFKYLADITTTFNVEGIKQNNCPSIDDIYHQYNNLHHRIIKLINKE